MFNSPRYVDGCKRRNRTGLFHLKYVAPCEGRWEGGIKTERDSAQKAGRYAGAELLSPWFALL